MKQFFKNIGGSILHWTWTKAFVYWLIISAGTVAECAFLIASLWICLNASVHSLMLAMMSETMTVRLTEISTAAYVGLPECILPLACVVTINHIRTWWQSRHPVSIVWAVLYGLPTIVFLILSAFTLGHSVLSTDFRLPDWMIVIRALSGFLFAITALLYWQLGKEHDADRLAKKDAEIDRLNQELEAKHRAYSIEIENMTQLLKTSTLQVNRLAEKASSLDRDVLALYPKVQSIWIESGVKTVTLNEIAEVTGLSKQRINAAAKADKFQKDNRNKDKVRVSSVIEWLKTLPVVESSNGHSNGHSFGDTDPLGLPVLSID